MASELNRLIILIKGGGEVASAVAHKLFRAHFRVLMTEIPHPIAVSRGVAFCEAVYDGEKQVEGVTAKLVSSAKDIPPTWAENKLPVIVDPQTSVRNILHPDIMVDAIMAKKNLGTSISDAPLVIGLGPGFRVGKDVHMIIETNNSESLGKVILSGEAEPNTGVALSIGGFAEERVLHAPAKGLFHSVKQIGDLVSAGDTVAWVNSHPVKAQIGGVVRALLRDGIEVDKKTKLGEVDPSGDKQACYSIRPRMRAIAGGVLEAILMHFNT